MGRWSWPEPKWVGGTAGEQVPAREVSVIALLMGTQSKPGTSRVVQWPLSTHQWAYWLLTGLLTSCTKTPHQ